MNLKKFENKNILITGASSGIGEAIALQLANTSARLFLTGRDRERLKTVGDKCAQIRQNAADDECNQIHSAGKTNVSDCSLRMFHVDFSDMASIDNFVSTITKETHSFDYIFLNAGISQRALTLETDFSVDRTIMETNYFGPVYLIKQLFGLTKSDRPKSGRPIHIAITTSISGLFGFPLRSAYCASKHALFGFFESLALEDKNIKVTFLIPGRINTPISKNAVLGDGSLYAKMDSGQATGMDVDKCARIALRAIAKGKRRKLIGGKELLMVYLKKYAPALFYRLAQKISAT